MERGEVLGIMRDKAQEQLGVEPDRFAEDAAFVADLGVDSLALIEYVMDLEDALGVELSEDELAGRTTVGEFLDVVMGALQGALNFDG